LQTHIGDREGHRGKTKKNVEEADENGVLRGLELFRGAKRGSNLYNRQWGEPFGSKIGESKNPPRGFRKP